MEETLAQLEALSGAAGRVAMATLVGFAGASPKKESRRCGSARTAACSAR